MDKKITWNDFVEATQHDLKKTYKVSDRKLEMEFRRHLDGASAVERQKMYDKFYKRRG